MNDAERREYAHLLKNNDEEGIAKFQEKMKRMNSSKQSFYDFMYDAIKQNGFTRSQVAQRAGLSRDYVFKLLNPNSGKRTDDRDYIIAICIAAKMGFTETQHALELYPFPILDDSDDRSSIIIMGLLGSMKIDDLNEMLENAGHPLLRTNPDMKKVAIGPVRSTFSNRKEVVSNHDEELIASVVRRLNMKKEKIEVWTQPFGCMPCDDGYLAETKFTDSDGTEKYAQLVICSEGSSLSIGKKSLHELFDEDADEAECIEDVSEEYFDTWKAEEAMPDEDDENYDEDLDAYAMMFKMASTSKHFKLYNKLDAAVDEEINGTGENITIEELSSELAGSSKQYKVIEEYFQGSEKKVETIFDDIHKALNFAQERFDYLVGEPKVGGTLVTVETDGKLLWQNEKRY